jgi:hypothetical protein
MSALSDYAENELLDHLLGTTSFTMPAQVYVALFVAAPSDSGGGTEVSTSGTAYAREPVDFAAASGGAANPTGDVQFDEATGNWGTVTHLGLFDAASGGNLLMHGALAVSKLIETGDTFRIPAADLDVSVA